MAQLAEPATGRKGVGRQVVEPRVLAGCEGPPQTVLALRDLDGSADLFEVEPPEIGFAHCTEGDVRVCGPEGGAHQEAALPVPAIRR